MDQGVVKSYDPVTGVGIVVRDADRSEVFLRPGSLRARCSAPFVKASASSSSPSTRTGASSCRLDPSRPGRLLSVDSDV